MVGNYIGVHRPLSELFTKGKNSKARAAYGILFAR